MKNIEKKNLKLSFVIPCYCCELTIGTVIERILHTVELCNYDFEIILVNDGSKDKTYTVIKEIAKNNNYIKVIDLAKNSGQHAAILAGFNHVTGDLVITLDDDGQTPVENLPQMLEKLEEGYDVISAKYNKRNQPSLFRKIGTIMNRKMSKWLIEQPEGIVVSVFLVLRRFVVNEIIKYDQPYPYLSGLVLRITHNIGNVEMEQAPREVGQSGYSFHKLLSLWINGFTAFSIKPLRIATVGGTICAGIGLLFAVITFVRKLFIANIQVGWSSLVSIMLFLGGIILIVLGLIGEYMGRIYMCINNTPQFVIRETYGFERKENDQC